jgi:hypothetical protein
MGVSKLLTLLFSTLAIALAWQLASAPRLAHRRPLRMPALPNEIPKPAPPETPAAPPTASWLEVMLARLRATSSAGEKCALLSDLRATDDERVTYAITDVLEHTTRRSVRACAAEALARQATAPARSWLIDLSHDWDPGVHGPALDALATSDDGTARGTVDDAAHDADPSIEKCAVIALLRARRPEAFALAEAMVRATDSPETLNDVVEALGDAGDPRAMPLLVAEVERAGGDVRRTAMRAIGSLGGEEAIRGLAPYLREGTPEELADVVRALSKIASYPLVARIAEVLDDPNAMRRRMALAALHEMGGSDVHALMMGLARGTDVTLAPIALGYLARSHDPEVIALLVQEEEQGVAGHAGVHALARMDDPRAVAALRRLAASGDRDAREAALDAMLSNPDTRAEAREVRIAELRRSPDKARWEDLSGLAGDPSDEAQKAVADYVSLPNAQQGLRSRLLIQATPETLERIADRAKRTGDAALANTALAAMAEQADPRFAPALRQAARYGDAEARQTALRGLAALGDDSLPAAIRELARSGRTDDRSLAVELARTVGDGATLTALARSGDADVAVSALGALEEHDPAEALAVAWRAYERSDADVRSSILAQAQSWSAATLVPLCTMAMRDANPETAMRAVQTMATLDAPEAERALFDVAMSAARPEEVRRAAANELWDRGGPLVTTHHAALDLLRDHEQRPHG